MSQEPGSPEEPLPGQQPGPAANGDEERRSETEPARRGSRTGALWTAVTISIVLLMLLIIFILQNSDPVLIVFFGLEGSIPSGIALLIAAVAGAAIVAIAGIARLTHVRINERRARRQRAK